MASAPPTVVEDLATACVRLVREALGLSLAHDGETLPLLDHYLRNLDGDGTEETDGATGGGARERMVAFVAPCAGAYFGEVLRRLLPGARWELPADESDYAAWRLTWPRLGLSLNPVGSALEAVHDEPLPGWGAHLDVPEAEREIVGAALERTGGVREEDFHRLAVRFEVLEQVHGLLSDRRRAREAD